MDKISVCIATYNGEKYIVDQLSSILNQIGEEDEVIISDDNSTDATINLIKNLNDRRIKIFTGTKFGNPIYNFENAMKKISGNLVLLADQDDIWLKDKVSTMLNLLKTFDVVVSDCYMGDKDLNIIKESYFEWRASKAGLLKNIWRNSYLGCCMAFRAEVLKKALPFPKNIPMHDMWIGLIGELYYKTFFIKKPFIIYRRHGDNATTLSENFNSLASPFQKLKYRLNLVLPLLIRAIKCKFK